MHNIHSDDIIAKEGELRVSELNAYLKKMNVEKKVWLSEDGTAIQPKITYDPKTNKLVGLVPPLDTNGCPSISR